MSVEVERIDNIRPYCDDCDVTLKKMGNISEVRYSTRETGGYIQKINKDEYTDLRSGEIKEFKHHAVTRADNVMSVSQSLRRLRDILNTNITRPESCIWLTLTYRENMTDTIRLYDDFERFMKRLRYYLKKQALPSCEYIAAMEPQARGAWHCHCVLLFDSEKAPFIPNADMAEIWRHGFTKTKSLTDVDNIGLYLTAYLTDMELSEVSRKRGFRGDKLKVVSTIDEHGKPVPKAIVKGARLSMYPAGFRLYRASRGIKKPEIVKCTEGEAMREVDSATLTYERTIRVLDEFHCLNVINYRQYNSKAKKSEPEA